MVGVLRPVAPVDMVGIAALDTLVLLVVDVFRAGTLKKERKE